MNRDEYRELVTLVKMGEDSQLKRDLNRGVASLQSAPESWFQPHLCLNEEHGMENIRKIAAGGESANTEFFIHDHPIIGGEDVWLNIRFGVFLNGRTQPTNFARLSPRQTAYIVKHLPPESLVIVLTKVKNWYVQIFQENMRKGLETISTQFETGNPLLESDDKNRIFDIHGGRVAGMDIPYVEWNIVGENLFGSLFFGVTFLDHGLDGYERMDQFLANIDRRRKGAVEGALGLMRALR